MPLVSTWNNLRPRSEELSKSLFGNGAAAQTSHREVKTLPPMVIDVLVIRRRTPLSSIEHNQR